MLRRLHWLILRRLPGPFFGWLGILMFLLLMQFLIRWLPEITGKGIPVLVIIELIAYNLAYMLVLAVPMSVLLAALMAFGDLAKSQYYTVIKSTGISFGEIVWPALVAAALVCGGLLYFNTYMLPEANFRARQLWSDIRNKRPGFELQPGTFYDGVEDYSILVKDRPAGSNELIGVTIYDYTEGRNQQAVIKARRGHIRSQAGGRRLTLVLNDGEMHRPRPPTSGSLEPRYEKLEFDRHVIHFDLSDVVFSRSSGDDASRSTRTTPLPGLLDRVDSLQADLHQSYQDLYSSLSNELLPDTARAAPADSAARPDSAWTPVPKSRRADRPYFAIGGLDLSAQQQIAQAASHRARSIQSEIENVGRTVGWQEERLRSYQVEVHKKFSIAVACLIFMIIGAPIGLALRRSGLSVVGAVALGIFIFYWACLNQGEKLSERGFFPPWVGMWIANVLMSGVSLWLLLYVVLDLGATPPLRDRLWAWLTSERS
jgi:lipopolysaccharide export system permease protein